MSTNENQAVDINSARPCTRCKGEGRTHSQWAVNNGYETAEGRKCLSCDGQGTFPGLDVKALVNACFTTKGAKKFRKSFVSPWGKKGGGVASARAYYIWRLARFHGGADVCMPVTADMVTGGDPFKNELNLIAEHVAKLVYGTDMAGASRWGVLLGFVKEAPAGLPASAYEGGPVADENKPAFEAMELT